MFPNRGLVVLIALCAFGATHASFLGRDDFRWLKHRFHFGGFKASNSSGNANVTVPSGNYSHPEHFNSSGNSNWPPVRSHKLHRFNSSYVNSTNSSSVPSWYYRGKRHGFDNSSLASGNFSYPGSFNSSGNWTLNRPNRSHRLHHLNSTYVGNANATFVPRWNTTGQVSGFRPAPGNFSSPGNFSLPFPRGQRPVVGPFVNRRASYGNLNSPRLNRPVNRPALNSTWARPVNGTRVYLG